MAHTTYARSPARLSRPGPSDGVTPWTAACVCIQELAKILERPNLCPRQMGGWFTLPNSLSNRCRMRTRAERYPISAAVALVLAVVLVAVLAGSLSFADDDRAPLRPWPQRRRLFPHHPRWLRLQLPRPLPRLNPLLLHPFWGPLQRMRGQEQSDRSRSAAERLHNKHSHPVPVAEGFDHASGLRIAQFLQMEVATGDLRHWCFQMSLERREIRQTATGKDSKQ